MKKFIFAAYVAATVLMVPAIFIGYLHTDSDNSDNVKNVSDVKKQPVQSASANQETSYKPGLVFILRGV
jgi:hypothetical protein